MVFRPRSIRIIEGSHASHSTRRRLAKLPTCLQLPTGAFLLPTTASVNRSTMLLYVFLSTVVALVCGGLNQGRADPADESLLVNAIVAKNNISMAECWKIEPGYQVSNVTGTVGDKDLQLGSMTNAVFIIIPDDDGKPNNGGLHNGAHSQWVFALTGGVTVTFPEHPGGFSVPAGGVFISTDILGTSTLGHQSIWAAGANFIQAPFPNGVAINHTVVPNRLCKGNFEAEY
ncbi:hypothetical protein C8F01DRAFT_1162851 [Mycena amicta]|nr:hypothetical protein C8F01DRAFT_1162851 [Mycena amicta]